MSTVREKNRAHIVRGLKPVSHLLKSWFLNVGYDYINRYRLNQTEEDVLESITNHYLQAIKNLEQMNLK